LSMDSSVPVLGTLRVDLSPRTQTLLLAHSSYVLSARSILSLGESPMAYLMPSSLRNSCQMWLDSLLLEVRLDPKVPHDSLLLTTGSERQLLDIRVEDQHLVTEATLKIFAKTI